ncbi:MAG: hypothetical protein JNK47_02835 [Mesorhizobium sp.]|nr:hypothetical protein [Mesorhizobium sp.]MBL8576136.1 hypothetical protein [Mesorhizobium sp.]
MRGRPAFKPSDDQRTTVERMRFCGDSEAVIARAIGIDPDTLRKYFRDQLDNGHARRRKEVVDVLFEAAAKHNVAAAKRLEEMGRAGGAAQEIEARSKEPAKAKLGKKEAANEAAKNVASKFQPPAPPKLVVNNR